MNRQGRSGGQLLDAGPFSVPHGPGRISSIRFCILDEVGAALAEANTGRFTAVRPDDLRHPAEAVDVEEDANFRHRA